MTLDTVYFVERRLYKARIEHFKKLAKSKRLFAVTNNPSEAKYLVAQESTGNEVVEYLQKHQNIEKKLIKDKLLVDVQWYIECLKSSSVVPVDKRHILEIIKTTDRSEEPTTKKARLSQEYFMYACQRSTPLHHPNSRLTDALEILEEHAMFRLDFNSDVRALAFRRGSATLKACPYKITSVDQLKRLPYIDTSNSAKAGHCKKVIMEILSEGFSDEVEGIQNSDFYKSMKLFCGIWGVGPSTAKKWIDGGLKKVEEVKSMKLNKDQTAGLDHYEDLNCPVTKEEAMCVEKIVQTSAIEVNKDLEVTLVGGFRRGKSSGHDVDLLISHPIPGEEKGILHKIMDRLKDSFLYTDKKMASSTTTPTIPQSSVMDHFEKCFSIFKLKRPNQASYAESERKWKAVRVDLIVVPAKQFAFALLGWTGTKHFEREIRRYAKTEKKITLSSHGMYHTETKGSIEAKTEEEIFEKLDLQYRPPSERCC